MALGLITEEESGVFDCFCHRILVRWKLSLVSGENDADDFSSAFAMSAIRIAFSVTYYNSTPDTITYNTLSMAIVTVCELSVSLISACIPATYHIIREYLRKVKPILVAGRNTLQELTGYIHGPRRPKTFLQMPSLGPRFRASLGLFFRSTDLLDTGNEEGSEESKVGVVNR